MQAINIIHKETRQQYTIEVSTGSGEKQSICPICSHDRKKSTQKCLGFNVDKKIGRCNHCDAEFYEKINTDELKSILKPRKTYLKPLLSTFELSDKAIHYFEVSRLISIETARYFRLGSKSEFMPLYNFSLFC
jgi:twinkle protein